ncbi:hypothetical protein [uncultured Victivallis sp.]|uniref:hypothetical protein n=1 Tax=uncultured Victivallis sp. TaxID=354118 RepID=UPI0025904952|nr:hypothetical protein [uncultured Victivallis sp.]
MGNDRAAKEPRMKFRRIGGFYQLNVTDLQDLRYALELDEAHWALNSIDLDSMYTDRQFLNFVDDDHNGMIRVDEVKRAIRWYLDRIKPDSDPGAGTDVLHLDAINSDTPDGAILSAAARVVLENLGTPDASSLTLSQIRNDKQIIASPGNNGDGVITPGGLSGSGVINPHSTADELLAGRIKTIMATVGSVKDLTGEDGIDGKLLDAFIAGAQTFLDWKNAPAKDPATLLPFGENTAAFHSRYAALKDRIDQFFLNSAALRFLPDSSARLVKVDAVADIMNAATVRDFLDTVTIAEPSAAEELDFDAPLNPLFADALEAFAADPAVQPFLAGRKLSVRSWRNLKATIAPYANWLGAKPGDTYDKFDPAELAAMLTDGSMEQLRSLIESDLAVAREISAYDQLLKLVLFNCFLLPFLNNYVCLSDLFNPHGPAMLQSGKLVMDGRHFTLAMQIKNIAEHKRIATMSDICVAYVEITTGPTTALRKLTLAVAITSGNMRNLFIGKRGVFFTPDGVLWDARVIDFIQQPVSVSEALRMPFYRFGEFVTKQADKYFTSKSADAQKAMEKNIATGALPLPPAPAPAAKVQQTPAFSGSMLLMGGGIGIAAIGSMIAFIVKSLQNVSILNVLAVLFGIILIFGGPMVVISLVKLYRRNMARFLEANACAVNRPMRLSRKMGAIFTFTPPLPASSLIREDLVDIFHGPIPRHRLRWTLITILLCVLALAATYWFWGKKYFEKPEPKPAVKVEAPAAPVPDTQPRDNTGGERQQPVTGPASVAQLNRK